MTDFRVSVATDTDRYRASCGIGSIQEPYSAPNQATLARVPVDQRFAAEVDGADPATYPGIYGVVPLELAVPAHHSEPRLVRSAGLACVGMHPGHRFSNLHSAMLRDHLQRVHETAGTYVSTLHANESEIYRHHGYGLASMEHEVTLVRGAVLSAPGLRDTPAITTQVGMVTDRGVPERLRTCHRAHVETGEVVGTLDYYEQIWDTRPDDTVGGEAWHVLFARRDGEDVGFAVFRHNHKREHVQQPATLEVWKVSGDTETRLALLDLLIDFKHLGSVKLRNVSSEDPVLTWTGAPRSVATCATYENLRIRIVDLPEAITARGWSNPCDVVVEVTDWAARWNEGRWRIAVDANGSASAEKTDADADLRLPIEALGASYTGGGNLVGLVRAGVVAEARAGAARELWRALRTDVAPSAAVGI